MRHRFIIALLLFIILKATGQQINRVEYFLDSDPGFGNGTSVSITPGTNVSSTFAVNISGVPAGIHILSVRARDDSSKWGSVSHIPFLTFGYSMTNIVQLEYYFDTDPGYGLANQVTITPGLNVSKTFTPDFTGIVPGIHNLVVRAKKTDQSWSTVAQSIFHVFQPYQQNLTGLEYYFDTDPGYGLAKQVTITPGVNISKTFTPDFTGVSPGIHNLVMRAKKEDKTWGIIAQCLFHVYEASQENLTGLEYYFDTDPGMGNGKQVSVTQGKNISTLFSLDITGLSKGIHNLCIRAKNSVNRWSLLENVLFVLDDVAPLQITQVEYFYDTDPGYGNGKQLMITPTMNLSAEFAIKTVTLPTGEYSLVTRAKNSANRWSIIQSKTFTVENKTWTGLVDDDWSKPGNWDPSGVPLLTDKVFIPYPVPNMPVVKDQGNGCHDIFIQNQATLNINPGIELTITGELWIDGE